MDTKNQIAWLLLLMFVAATMALLQFEGLDIIDESTYAKAVHCFLQNGVFSENPSHFSNRTGMLFPAFFFTKIFGESAFSFVVFCFLCYLLLSLLLFFFFNEQYRVTASFWLVLNPVVSKLSVKFLPDVPMLLFFGASVLVLLRIHDTKKFALSNCLSLIFLIVWGCYCKEAMLLFMLPLFTIALLLPLPLRKKVFVSIVFAMLLSFILLYLFGQVAQASNHVMNNRFFSFSGVALLKRILIDPLIFAFSNAGYALVFIPAAVAFFQPIRNNKFFVLKTLWVSTVVVSFYASVSVEQYVPLQLIYRYHLPTVFTSILLGVQLFSLTEKLVYHRLKNSLLVMLLLVIFTSFLQNFFYKANFKKLCVCIYGNCFFGGTSFAFKKL